MGPKTYLGWKVDYSEPKREAAFCDPNSISWQVFKNPIALGIGGITAVLLEFADARIRSGVWDHSIFKTDPIGRAQRTGTAAMVGVYGPQSAARRVIQGVTNMHAKVEGTTPSGEAYKALDVELLDWVGATAAYGFLTAYDQFVSPLSIEEQNIFLQEGEDVAKLYGTEVELHSMEDFYTLMDRLAPRFEPHPINTEFLDIMAGRAKVAGVPKFLRRAVVNAAVEILPPIVREKLELGPEYNLSSTHRFILKLLGRIAERLPVPGSPPAQAAQRLGLPSSFVWKSKAARDRILVAHGEVAMQPGE